MPHAFLALLPLLLLPAFPQEPADSREWLNKGVQAYRKASYDEAIAAFQKAVDLDPEFISARLYLGMAYFNMYVPGASDPANLEFARNAESQFRQVLDRDPRNVVAMSSLASLAYVQTGGVTDPDERARRLDESAGWYQKLVAIDPRNKEGWYSLGVIVWGKWYPALMQARTQIGMKPDDSGPLRDPGLRAELHAKYGQTIEDGIEDLRKALEIDPEYDDAMAYLNLLYRERADLADTTQEYQSDIATADDWVQKTLTTKKNKAAQGPAMQRIPAQSSAEIESPRRIPNPGIRIQANPKGPQPAVVTGLAYPREAVLNGVQGVISVEVRIGADGRVLDAKAGDGPAVLCGAAVESVRQWTWKPAVVDSAPVEATTTVEVVFSLGGGGGGGGPLR